MEHQTSLRSVERMQPIVGAASGDDPASYPVQGKGEPSYDDALSGIQATEPNSQSVSDHHLACPVRRASGEYPERAFRRRSPTVMDPGRRVPDCEDDHL
jgi:hypothetical protein